MGQESGNNSISVSNSQSTLSTRGHAYLRILQHKSNGMARECAVFPI